MSTAIGTIITVTETIDIAPAMTEITETIIVAGNAGTAVKTIEKNRGPRDESQKIEITTDDVQTLHTLRGRHRHTVDEDRPLRTATGGADHRPLTLAAALAPHHVTTTMAIDRRLDLNKTVTVL